jgi:hypothetical protein
MADDDKLFELVFQCYMEEHKNCRAEIERSYVSKQKFYILEFILFCGILTFFVNTILNNNCKEYPVLVNSILMISPIFFYVASFIFIESHYRILDNAQYIHHSIKEKLQSLLKKNNLFEWEGYLSDKRNFKYFKTYELFSCEILANLICPTLLLVLFLVWRYTNFLYKMEIEPVKAIEIIFVAIDCILLLIVSLYEIYLVSQYKQICNKEHFLASLPRAGSLTNYGFKQDDEFKVSCLEEGKIVLEKK